MSSHKNIISAVILFAVVLIIGTGGYMTIEDYTLQEGLYMSIITITTVGFGEIRTLSDAGRLFTSFLILSGFISLAYAGRIVVESILENIWSGKLEIKKMKKMISKLQSHYIICGFGRVGSIAANRLHEIGSDFVVIESDPEVIQELKEKNFLYVQDDVTDENALLEAGIKHARGLLSLLASDPDNLFTVLSARELNPTLHIIARAEEASSEQKIYRAGADSVISPFATAGTQVANDLLAATGEARHITDLPSEEFDPQWVEIKEGSSMIGKSIEEVSNPMGKSILGLRRGDIDYVSPDPGMELESGDNLFVLLQSDTDKLETLEGKHANPGKIVIVDDNPVIVSLFARLFQKAGFIPITASNGEEGVEAILREKPDAAVVDFMLPDLSGIELCEKVRAVEEMNEMKLILFTADAQSETRRRALAAGADSVVIKSANSSEVIETVVRTLNVGVKKENETE